MPPGPLPNGPPQPQFSFPAPGCWNAYIVRTLASRHPNVKLGALSVSGGTRCCKVLIGYFKILSLFTLPLVLPFQSYSTTER